MNKSPKIARILPFVTTAYTLFLPIATGPLPFTQKAELDGLSYAKTDDYKTIEKWAERLKDDTISVSTTDAIRPFFTTRRYFYAFSDNYDNYNYADYVIVYVGNLKTADHDGETNPVYESLIHNPRFDLISSENSYEVYEKR